MMDRRELLTSLLAGAVALTAEPRLSPGLPRRRLRILMLGGTYYVGPHLVQAALDRGHEVTLFNRGITNPHLFPDLEKLRGDRHPGRGEGLAALQTTRTWDAVFDTWQGAPGCVDLSTQMFADRADRYVYISSIATYGNYRESGIEEEGPLLDATEHLCSFAELSYPVRKRAAEQLVERRFAAHGTVLRCTTIEGFNHSSDANAQAGYWAFRFLAGEPLLAPDDATAVIQLIDIKDVADFALRVTEQSGSGAYNLVGPEKPLLLRRYLGAWAEATQHRSQIVWVDPAFLLEHGVRPFEDLPRWIPDSDPEPGFYRISNARARVHGLTYRPLAETIRDIIASLGELATSAMPVNGMSRERELELIEAGRAWAAPCEAAQVSRKRD